MRSAILVKGEEYYSDLGSIFNSIENEQINYNWLITNCECYPQDVNVNEMFSREYLWISGQQLTEIIRNEDFQFIWGILSGFPPRVTLEEVLKHNLPYADCYQEYWIHTKD